MKHQTMKFTFAAFKEGCERPVNPLRVLMIAEPLEINAYIESGDGNGLGIVKPKAVMNQNWQVASTQVIFTPGLIGLVFGAGFCINPRLRMKGPNGYKSDIPVIAGII